MRLSITNSISAKIFFLMTALVLMTVIGMSLQSSNKFQNYLTQNIQDGSLSQAERTATDIANILEGWIGKVSVALTKINQTSTEQKQGGELLSLLRNEKDFFSVAVFVAEGETATRVAQANSTIPDPRFEGEDPSTLLKKTIDIANETANQLARKEDHQDISLYNVTPQTSLPLMQAAVRFKIDGQSNKRVYVIFTAWQTKLLLALPKSRFTFTTLMDASGNIFVSPDTNEMRRKTNIKSTAIAKQALAKKAPSGFETTYTDRWGKKRLGAFSQVAKYPQLFVIVEKDAEAAFRVISRNYLSAVLWAILFILVSVMVSFLSARSATKSLIDLVAVTKQIASGNFSVRLQPKTRDEIAVLGYSVNNMAERITDLLANQVEKARYEKELETARMVQSTFFPKQDIKMSPFTVTGFYQPATECGGDLWGHFKVDDVRQIVFIADAMGHGAPAALVTAIGYAACQAIAEIINDQPQFDASPSKILHRINRIIYEAVEGKISMTFFVALFDFANGHLTFSNAGHNHPVILTNDPNDSRLSKQAKAKAQQNATNNIPLSLPGTPLGVDPTAVFKEKTIEFKAGDRIFFFTDGLIENHYVNQEPMERKKLLEFLSKSASGDCFSIKNAILAEASKQFGTTNLADDVTIVVAEVDKSWQRGVVEAPVASMVPPPPFLPPTSNAQAANEAIPMFSLNSEENDPLVNTDSKVEPPAFKLPGVG